MGFKEKLKEKRVEANLTQVQLAEKISVTARTIQNYELGTRKPTKYAIVEQLAAARHFGRGGHGGRMGEGLGYVNGISTGDSKFTICSTPSLPAFATI